jgi:hypothetical protein
VRPEAKPPPKAEPPAERPAARVAELEGDVRASGTETAFAVGDVLHTGTLLRVGEGGKVVLDLENEVRVTLRAKSALLLVPEERATVVLLSGQMSATLLPSGSAVRLPARIATPDLSLQADAPFLVWLKASGKRATEVAVLGGTLQAVDVLREGPEITLPERSQYASLTGKTKPWPKDDLAKLANRFWPAPEAPLTAAQAAERAAALEPKYLEVQAQWDAQRDVQRTARRDQLSAHVNRDPRTVHRLQALVVEQAQRSVELRKRVRAWYERRLALAILAREGDADTHAAIARIAQDYAKLDH